MQQTLLALGALCIASYFLFSNRQGQMSTEQRLYRNEVEAVAARVGTDVLNRLGALPFDAATASGAVTNPSALTAMPFATHKRWQDLSDLDDVHRMQTHQVRIPTDRGNLDFHVEAQVTYVRKQGGGYVATTTPQFTKQVTVTVSGPMGASARLARLYDYGLF